MNAARHLCHLSLSILLASSVAFTQTGSVRVVVLGSSTAEGTGAPAGKGWVALFKTYLTNAGITSDVINLASGGYTTFDVLPTGYVSPYRSLNTSWARNPDTTRNITRALAYSPTDIVVNLPSNDALLEVPVSYQIAHMTVLQARAQAQGVRIWFTTSQPTKWLGTKLQIQVGMRDAVLAQFGEYAVDFWTGISTTDSKIQPKYDAGDGVHVNELGHAVLFESAKSKVTFKAPTPAVGTIVDGGFETAPTPWAFVTNGTGAFSIVAGGTEGSKGAKITIQTAGTNVQLYEAPVALQANTRYKLTFDAYSNTGHDVALSFTKHVSPYTSYGLSSVAVDLETSWKSYTLKFTTSGFTGVATDARLMFWLTPYQTAGDEYYIDRVGLSVNTDVETEVDEPGPTLPAEFALHQNFPNPFNPTTMIRFAIPQSVADDADADRVTLSVFDLLGRKVATLVDGPMPAGEHAVQFDAAHLASGVYLYRLIAGTHSATQRMVLMR
jgi:lysophospholipase L1-like esterase